AAVLIASVAERRKAERLLDTANIKATWTPPPDAGAITAAAEARFVDEIVAAPPPEEGDAAGALLATIEDRIPARELARRLLARELGRLPVGERIHPVAIAPATPDRHPQSGPRRSRADFSHEGT